MIASESDLLDDQLYFDYKKKKLDLENQLNEFDDELYRLYDQQETVMNEYQELTGEMHKEERRYQYKMRGLSISPPLQFIK